MTTQPTAQSGIPNIFGENWNRFDPDEDTLAYAIAYEAMCRFINPFNWIQGKALTMLLAECEAHMAPEVFACVGSLIHLLDSLQCIEQDYIVQVCAAVLPNLPPATGTMEATLQAALDASGLGSVDAANTLLQESLSSEAIVKQLKEIWPEHAPEGLTIMQRPFWLKRRADDAIGSD